MTICWRPHHEVHPELPHEPDFLARDEAAGECIGRVPFETHGREDTRGAAGRRVVEAYRLLLAHNERYARGIAAQD